MAQGISPDLQFHVEAWDQADHHVGELIAACDNLIMARAAFDAAVEVRPGANLLLRHGARVVGRARGQTRGGAQ
jgi:hypothetical protein